MKKFKLIHIATGKILAEGEKKDFFQLEGNYYLKEFTFKEGVVVNTIIPGLCFYKFIYIWVNIKVSDKIILKNFGWKYIIPNPIFFKIFKRIGIPIYQDEIKLETFN